VRFPTIELAHRALATMQGVFFAGKRLRVDRTTWRS
jgi:RNA recognition motif-containing protein